MFLDLKHHNFKFIIGPIRCDVHKCVTKCNIFSVYSMAIFMIQKECHETFHKEILIKEKFMKVDYPLRFISSVANEFQNVKNVEIKVL